MNPFKAVWQAVTGTPKMVDNVFDKDNGLLTQVGTFIGNQQFTTQEQVIANKKMADSVQDFAVATLAENTDRSKTRRTLATEWFKMQVWLIKLNVLCVFIDVLAAELGTELHTADAIAVIAFSGLLWGVTSGIGLFFWGSHTLRSSKFAKDKE